MAQSSAAVNASSRAPPAAVAFGPPARSACAAAYSVRGSATTAMTSGARAFTRGHPARHDEPVSARHRASGAAAPPAWRRTGSKSSRSARSDSLIRVTPKLKRIEPRRGVRAPTVFAAPTRVEAGGGSAEPSEQGAPN